MVDGVTKITYRVTPPAILVILWVILLAVFVRSTLSVIFFHGDAVFLILSLLFPAALYGFTAWECSECVKDFESRLK